jgi:hypothetical protein
MQFYKSRTIWILLGNLIAWILILFGADEATANQLGADFVEHLIPLVGIASMIAGYFTRKAATGPLQGPVELTKEKMNES